MKVIFGLGNPGKEYEKTRHNAGTIVLGWIEKEFGSKKNLKIIFPGDFMNKSGPYIKSLKLKFKPEELLVIHDDLDINLGRTKLTFGRSSGGHKGVESVIKSFRTKNFWRLRVGLAPKTTAQKKKAKNQEGKDYLLSALSPAEQKALTKQKKKVLEGVESWLKNTEKAQNILNQK